MVIKKGRYGDFLACPNYPECKNTKMIAEEIGVLCPKCSSPIIKIKGNKGKFFYGCSSYPGCDYRSWYETVNNKCEKCGENKVVKMVNKKETEVCINKNCK